MALTRRQREVLDVIRDFIARNGYSPSLEEIGKALALSSVATVHKHVTHLVAKGYARRVWNQNRSVELTAGPDAEVAFRASVIGLLAAGAPIVTVSDGGILLLPPDLVPGERKVHALRVAGDSLERIGMRDGDLVVVEERQEARDGETVIASSDGVVVAVATFRREGNRVRLEGDKGDPLPFSEERFDVRGIVLGLVRRYFRS